jgi:hypothetical protein
MFSIGLDVHKRVISYGDNDGSGTIHAKIRFPPHALLSIAGG